MLSCCLCKCVSLCSGALKPSSTGFVQRKQFFAGSSQMNANTETERDIFIFGEPTEAVSSGAGGTELETSHAYTYKTFVDMGVCPQLASALKKTNKAIPTIIQKAAYDSIVAKKDVVICAETGSGKTMAYLLPVLEQFYTANEDRASSSRRSEGGGGASSTPPR
jgi:hypothetical protein